MINYLIEAAFVHILLYTLYLIFLSRESTQSIKRVYLLGSVFAALIVPFISVPIPSLSEPLMRQAQQMVLLDPVIIDESTKSIDSPTGWWTFYYLDHVYLGVSFLFAGTFILSIARIIWLVIRSRTMILSDTRVHVIDSLKVSFSFFTLIFVGDPHPAIIAHERAHGRLLHSVDIIFLSLFRTAFWWLPSAWFVLKEIRLVHEYQADAAASSENIDAYRKLLISASLAPFGMGLASSFHEGALIKRLKAMKNTNKQISKWKIGMLGMLAAGVVLVFSFQASAQDDGKGEIFKVVDKVPEFPGGNTKYFEYVAQNLKYPAVATQLSIEGKVFVEFIVEKDGGVSNVRVLKGIGGGCDEQAAEVVRQSPKFIPGSNEGKVVRTRMVLPILFKLSEKSNDSSDEIELDVQVDSTKH